MIKNNLKKRHFCHKTVHHNEVAEASAHHKQMKNLMGAKIFMFGIENGQFQRVDNASDGVDNTSSQKPAKGLGGERVNNLCKS